MPDIRKVSLNNSFSDYCHSWLKRFTWRIIGTKNKADPKDTGIRAN